jgi:hypothetical protein
METESRPLTLMAEALLIDGLVLALVVADRFSARLAFWGGAAIVFYLFVMAFKRPVTVFYLVLGTKLTFDALWLVKIPGLPQVGLLELYLLPVLVIVVLSLKSIPPGKHGIIWAAVLYLAWVFLAMILNGILPDLPLMLRQSGLLIGLIVGASYLRNERHLPFVFYLIFVSTIVPVLTSLLQIGLARFGLSVLHSKFDIIRGFRPSGLYYDPATMGMVSLLSLASNLYLLHLGRLRRGRKAFHLVFLALNIAVLIAGGTRSIMVASLLLLGLSATISLKRALKLVPVIAILVLLFWPSLSRVVERTVQWEMPQNPTRTGLNLREALAESDYRTMFSGRVSIWQDVWKKFKEGSWQQRFFGSGLSSNSHSSYFFLLLQIGWLGLLLYIVLHIRIGIALLRGRAPGFPKTAAFSMLALILVIGSSMTAVVYTSFQWIVYLVLAGVLSIWPAGRAETAGKATA